MMSLAGASGLSALPSGDRGGLSRGDAKSDALRRRTGLHVAAPRKRISRIARVCERYGCARRRESTPTGRPTQPQKEGKHDEANVSRHKTRHNRVPRRAHRPHPHAGQPDARGARGSASRRPLPPAAAVIRWPRLSACQQSAEPRLAMPAKRSSSDCRSLDTYRPHTRYKVHGRKICNLDSYTGRSSQSFLFGTLCIEP